MRILFDYFGIVYYTKYAKTYTHMKRVLFHGSEEIIDKPKYGIGNIHNDYGLGFYCTTNKKLASELAGRKNGFGYINKYFIRDDRLKVLDLTKPSFNSVLYWVSLLINNRTISTNLKNNYPRELEYLKSKYLIDTSKYDAIIGYRADDSYFHFPEAFIRSEITFNSLETIFKSGKLGKQYVIISPRAFNLIKFDSFEKISIKSYEDYYLRKSEADKTFSELLQSDRYSKEKRLIDMVKDYE